jgi:Immunity protein 26
MARGRRKKPTVGDVFQIPINEGLVGHGQVIAQKLKSYLIVVFRTAYPHEGSPDVKGIVGDDIAFVGESLDALIWSGDWPIIGNATPDHSRVPLPTYKVTIGSIDNWYVESYDGKRRRPAKPWELDSLQLQRVVAPVRLQKALQALHGVVPWDETYGLLKYDDYVRRASEVSV